MGDANKNANFFFSHGTNDAILDAQKWATHLSEPQHSSFNVEGYSAYQGKQVARHIDRLKMSNQPTDMPAIIRAINDNAVELERIAKSLSSSKFTARLHSIQNYQLSNNMKSLYEELVLLADEVNKYIEHKSESDTHFCCGLFSKDYSKSRENLDVLKKALPVNFRHYFETNPKKDQARKF